MGDGGEALAVDATVSGRTFQHVEVIVVGQRSLAVLAHRHGRLPDDATTLLVEWLTHSTRSLP